MTAKLVAEEGTLKGLVLSLEDSDQWVIGRDPDACQLLIEDPSASRKHMVCRTTPQGIEVENLSSSNPVQINDEEVKSPRVLQNGDAVKIGNGIYRFYSETTAEFFKEPSSKNGDQPPSTPHPAELNAEEAAISSIDQQDAGKPAPAAQPPEQNAINEPDPMKVAITDKDALIEENLPDDEFQKEKNSSENEPQQSIFDEEPSDKNAFAEINFGMLETGRWLLKVVGGPNNGAEFSMQSGMTYVVGTDPNSCDVVFHDTSVSRQHARLSVNEQDEMSIEDLKSRNGTVVDGESLMGKRALLPNTLVSVGTTSFIVFDREGEMQTIISPLMPSIVKALKNDEDAKNPEISRIPVPEEALPIATALEAKPIASKDVHHPATALGAFILIGILTGLFVIAGLGTLTLFKSEPVVSEQAVDPVKALDELMTPFPSVKYSFNKNTGQLLLVGHVLTSSDKSQLIYTLQGLKFIKNLNESGIVIDEFVWREINQIIEKNPDWKGISIMSSSPGHFMLSGYLQTRAQADRLSEYLSANFPYPELLEKKIIVDQEVAAAITTLMTNHGYPNVTPKCDNGEVVLTGDMAKDMVAAFGTVVNEVKEIRGVRNVRNLVVVKAAQSSLVNISDKYEVTGVSVQAGRLSVVINGRILMKGDILDGMTITAIKPNSVSLEKEDTKYRIDFNR